MAFFKEFKETTKKMHKIRIILKFTIMAKFNKIKN